MKFKVLFLFSLFITIISYSQQKKVTPIDLSFGQFMSCRDFTISSNENEAYFTVQNLTETLSLIVKTTKINKTWEKFEMISFSGNYRDIEPFLSPDNLTLYFASNRPKNGETKKSDNYDIWYVKRKTVTDKWSEPINIGAPINTSANEFYPAISTNKNLYYTSDRDTKTKKDEILVSQWNGKHYESPTNLNTNINSYKHEFNAYVSPDESFLIYSIYKAEDGIGSGDLYISFKDKNGNFKKRVNMGKAINSTKMDYCPFYNQKTNTLFFTSKRNEVSHKKVSNLSEFKELINQYANGLSKIYKSKVILNKKDFY